MKRKYAFLSILTITVLVSAFVWIRLRIVNISYDIDSLQRKEKNLREESSQLTQKINEARSAPRLEKIARDRLNMTEPKADQIVVLKDEK